MEVPEKLKRILDKNNSINTNTNIELLKLFELKETSPNELTFFVNNYQTIFKKNKKIIKKELL
jgi:hypothetical protein